MTNSMTAYSQASVETEIGELSCELRSVNHRYLEIAPRMPEELRVNEPALRELISSRLARGRVDCFIRLHESESNSLEANIEIVSQLKGVLRKAERQIPNMQAIRAIDILRWPGVLQAKQVAPEVLKKALLTVLEQALDGLVAGRQQEGKKMAELIAQRLQSMQAIIDGLIKILPEIAEQYRERIDSRLEEIKEQLDPARLEQEMVIFMQKTDVAEELDRLKVHIDEVANVLAKPEPAGRRLDFLMQELNREANTLGSKSQDARLTKASVDIKVLIEQMREQVQNIE